MSTEKPRVPEVLEAPASAPESLRPPTYYNIHMVRFMIGVCIGVIIDAFLIRYEAVLTAYDVIDLPRSPYELAALPLVIGFVVMSRCDLELNHRTWFDLD